MRPTLARLSLCLLLAPAIAQAPVVPGVPALPMASPAGRYIDFSADLDRPGVVVVTGRLGKCKEGKRERLENAVLGGAGSVAQVSGTQYFKVPVTTSITPRTVLFGKADKLALAFDLQLARLPDGKEQRQATTGTGAPLQDDLFGLFVVAPKAKGKGLDLLHVIPFDPKVDQGPNGELQFADAMFDFYTVNRRAHDLRAALAVVDQATEAGAREKALKALQELVEQKVELRQSQNDGLLSQHVGPLEARAQKRLAEAGAAAAKDAAPKAGDAKD